MEADFQPFEDLSPGDIPVRGYLHLPENPSNVGLVLTHGAGANCKAPLLVAVANAFCKSGMAVLRCDLPFRQSRPYGPPHRGSADRDQQGLRRAAEVLRQRFYGRIFLGGHSYGGRQCSILAASESATAEALLLLSYPLHPPRAPAQLRTAHFPALRTPALFIHGTRDGFGSVDDMNASLKLIPSRTRLLSVAGAGHELMTTANRSTLPDTIVDAFLGFVAAHR